MWGDRETWCMGRSEPGLLEAWPVQEKQVVVDMPENLLVGHGGCPRL